MTLKTPQFIAIVLILVPPAATALLQGCWSRLGLGSQDPDWSKLISEACQGSAAADQEEIRGLHPITLFVGLINIGKCDRLRRSHTS